MDKTEIILITGMRIPKIINVNIANKFLITSEAIKYLRVTTDSRGNYLIHLKSVCCRADAIVGLMRRLLPNVNGPSNIVRRKALLQSESP